MNKFFILLKKEIRDILSPQTIIPIFIMVLLFYFMGTFMGGILEGSAPSTEGKASAQNTVAVIDLDKTDGSAYMITAITSGYHIYTPPGTVDPAEAYNKYPDEFNVLIIIPRGFGELLNGNSGEAAEVKIYSNVTSFSVFSIIGESRISAILDSISETLSESLLEKNLNKDAPSLEFLKEPIKSVEYTRVNGKIEQIPAIGVISLVTSQTMFVPVIVFLIVIFSSQTLAASVTGEKADKTLETLLTVPMRRIDILIVKMLSASIVSLLYVVIFGISFKSYMGKMMSGLSVGDFGDILEKLGLSFDFITFLVAGVSLFLSIIIGLAFAIITGIIAEDLKKLQSLLMPMIIIMMIPYMISLVADINTLPLIARILIYLIPFTHTFTVVNNIFTANYPMLFVGIIYQLIFLIFSIGIATRIFGSDKLFTLKINIGRKKEKKTEN